MDPERASIDVLVLTALQDELDAVLTLGEGGSDGWEELRDLGGFRYYRRAFPNARGEALQIAAAWTGEMGARTAAIRGQQLLAELRSRLPRDVRHLRGVPEEGGARRRDRGRSALRLRRGEGRRGAREAGRGLAQPAHVRPGGDVEDGCRLPGAGAGRVGAGERAPALEGGAAPLAPERSARSPGRGRAGADGASGPEARLPRLDGAAQGGAGGGARRGAGREADAHREGKGGRAVRADALPGRRASEEVRGARRGGGHRGGGAGGSGVVRSATEAGADDPRGRHGGGGDRGLGGAVRQAVDLREGGVGPRRPRERRQLPQVCVPGLGYGADGIPAEAPGAGAEAGP